MNRAKKIKRGLYQEGKWYLTSTERLGSDKAVDWVAVSSIEEAEWIGHGNLPREDIQYVHNTLTALTRIIRAEEGGAA